MLKCGPVVASGSRHPKVWNGLCRYLARQVPKISTPSPSPPCGLKTMDWVGGELATAAGVITARFAGGEFVCASVAQPDTLRISRVLCWVACVDLRHEHATHAICVSAQCTHSTSLIRVTASDGHIVGDIAVHFRPSLEIGWTSASARLGPSGTIPPRQLPAPRCSDRWALGPCLV